MNAACYQVLANPNVHTRLRAELATLSRTADGIPNLSETEALPYLAAIIQETIRLHPGAMSRQIRVSPEVPILYSDKVARKDYAVPPGTVYSMSPLLTHMHAECFNDPYAFRPERWIENPKLSRYFIGFGRGSRNCLGWV